MEIRHCEGCGKQLGVGDTGYTVCIECTKARHRAVVNRKCSCGNKRRPTEIKRIGSRTWISCYRCLGQIKQVS
jgi:hypothetical protein